MIVKLINKFYKRQYKDIKKIYVKMLKNKKYFFMSEIFLFCTKDFFEFCFLFFADKELIEKKDKCFSFKELSMFNLFSFKIIVLNLKKEINEDIEEVLLSFFEENYNIYITQLIINKYDKFYAQKLWLINLKNLLKFLKKQKYL